MQLTTAQKATFKTWLDANASGQSDDAAAALANALASPNYFVWLPDASKAAVDAQINKANYTPSDAAPASPSTDMTYQNRALLCQLKQTNAQWLTSITLCEKPGHDCHFVFGHAGDWHGYVPSVEEDARRHLGHVKDSVELAKGGAKAAE